MWVGILPVYPYVYHVRESTRRPEEDTKSPETGVMLMMGTELGSSAIAASTLNS